MVRAQQSMDQASEKLACHPCGRLPPVLLRLVISLAFLSGYFVTGDHLFGHHAHRDDATSCRGQRTGVTGWEIDFCAGFVRSKPKSSCTVVSLRMETPSPISRSPPPALSLTHSGIKPVRGLHYRSFSRNWSQESEMDPYFSRESASSKLLRTTSKTCTQSSGSSPALCQRNSKLVVCLAAELPVSDPHVPCSEDWEPLNSCAVCDMKQLVTTL